MRKFHPVLTNADAERDRTDSETGVAEICDNADLIASSIHRVIVTPNALRLELRSKQHGDDEHTDKSSQTTPAIALIIPWKKQTAIRRRAIILPTDSEEQDAAAIPPIRAEARARLLTAIAKARHWLNQLISGDMASTEAIANHNKVSERTVRDTLLLAFLAPDLVQAAVDGSLPHGAGLVALADAPVDWAEQAKMLAPKDRPGRRV